MTIRGICNDKLDCVLDDLYQYTPAYTVADGMLLRKTTKLPKLDVFIDDFQALVYFESDGFEDWQNDMLEYEMNKAEEYISLQWHLVRFERHYYYFMKWKEKWDDKLINPVRSFMYRCFGYLE